VRVVLPSRRAPDATPPVAPLAVLDELPLPGGELDELDRPDG
jgi:hypothetical protein